jgi:hypothetical protein
MTPEDLAELEKLNREVQAEERERQGTVCFLCGGVKPSGRMICQMCEVEVLADGASGDN